MTTTSRMSNQSSPNGNASVRLSVTNIWKANANPAQLLIPSAHPISLPTLNNTRIGSSTVNNNSNLITNNFANNSVNTPNQIPSVVNKSSEIINNNINTPIIIPDINANNLRPKNTGLVDSALKKPPNAFMLYSNEMRLKLKNEFPDMKQAELAKMIGARWKSCHPDEKAKYGQKAAELLAEWKAKHPDWEEALKQKRLETAAKSKKRRASVLLSPTVLASDSLSVSESDFNDATSEPAPKKRKIDSHRSATSTQGALTTDSLKDSLLAANNILNNITLFLTSRNQAIPVARPSDKDDTCQRAALKRNNALTDPLAECFDDDQASDSSHELHNENSSALDTRAD